MKAFLLRCENEWGDVRGVFHSLEDAQASPLVTMPTPYRREKWGWRRVSDTVVAIRRLDTKSPDWRSRYSDWSIEEWPVLPEAQ